MYNDKYYFLIIKLYIYVMYVQTKSLNLLLNKGIKHLHINEMDFI